MAKTMIGLRARKSSRDLNNYNQMKVLTRINLKMREAILILKLEKLLRKLKKMKKGKMKVRPNQNTTKTLTFSIKLLIRLWSQDQGGEEVEEEEEIIAVEVITIVVEEIMQIILEAVVMTTIVLVEISEILIVVEVKQTIVIVAIFIVKILKNL